MNTVVDFAKVMYLKDHRYRSNAFFLAQLPKEEGLNGEAFS
jgi:hypothetical protein